MLSNDVILSQVKAVEQILQIEPSLRINETLTNEELKTAAKMFLYLNICPVPIKPWIVFYKDLFITQSPDQIILTLNRIMKGPRTEAKEIFKEMTKTFFRRILSMLHRYESENKAPEDKGRQPQKLEGGYTKTLLFNLLFCP